MKTKLRIDFLKKGQETELLAIIVTNHNARVNPVSLDDIASYLWVRRSVFDLYNNSMYDVHGKFEDDDKTTLYIMEKGECIAAIEEIEIQELATVDDLSGVLEPTG